MLTSASLIQPARPAPPADWLRGFEYPKDALNRGERGTVLLNAVISPAGDVISCEPVNRTPLNNAACRRVLAGHRFIPAMDWEGRPAHGVYKIQIDFRIRGLAAAPRVPLHDILLTVESLPATISDPSYSLIIYSVMADGKIGRCFPRRLEKAQSDAVATFLDEIACAELAKSPLIVARDTAGRPVESVQRATVKFATPVRDRPKPR